MPLDGATALCRIGMFKWRILTHVEYLEAIARTDQIARGLSRCGLAMHGVESWLAW